MYEKHDNIDTPPPDTILWRYMNLEKLLALLCSSTLYCCRLDRLADPWEGVWPKPVLEAVRRAFEAMQMSSESFGKDFWERERAFMFANCWHESSYESAALWNQYADSAGLAIRSTVKRLINANHSAPRFFIGRVKYLDYEREAPIMKLLNRLVPPFLKRKSFEHEREVRMLVWEVPIRDHKMDRTCPVENHAIPVDVKILVESIHLSPKSPPWLVGHVRELLQRFDLADIPVQRSELYDKRVY